MLRLFIVCKTHCINNWHSRRRVAPSTDWHWWQKALPLRQLVEKVNEFGYTGGFSSHGDKLTWHDTLAQRINLEDLYTQSVTVYAVNSWFGILALFLYERSMLLEGTENKSGYLSLTIETHWPMYKYNFTALRHLQY